jgi:uncharacterized membrane protein
VSTWTLIRFLHLLGVIFFVGGQLLLTVAVAPVLRARGDAAAVRSIAMRFGIGSVVALLVLVATGAAMASHYGLWGQGTLQVKLMVLVLVLVLTGLHVVSTRTRAIAAAILAGSVLIVWLGVKLTYG